MDNILKILGINKTDNSSEASIALILKQVVDNMSNGCMVLDKDFKFTYINKTISEQSNADQQRLLGKSILEEYSEMVGTEVFRRIQEAMKNKIRDQFEDEFTFKDGHKAWYSMVLRPFEGGLIILTEHIGEKKINEQKLISANQNLDVINKTHEQTSSTMIKVLEDLEKTKVAIDNERARDEAMLKSIGEGVFAVDKDNKFIIINKEAERMIGIGAAKLIGKEKSPSDVPLEYISGEPILVEDRPTRAVLKSGKQFFSDKIVLVNKNGSKTPIALTVTPIKLNNKIVGAIDVFRDITLEKQIDRAKTEFVYLASHQLRTPLGIIKWYIESLTAEKYFKDAPVSIKDYVTEISKNNERLLDLVRNLLSVSRIDEGRIRDEPQEIDVVETIKPIIDEIKKIPTSIHVEVSFKPVGKVPKIFIDPVKFSEVLENLLVNAIKYNKENGKVELRVKDGNGKVQIEIKDTGIGISKEDVKHIFGKFFRSEGAISNNPEGSGLGLYVANSYVESWGGKISVKSILGKGSVFTIILPLKIKRQ
ncbi:MAG: ATP-binding protein [Candidatus Dojkabacteria bacterium]